MSYTHLTKQHDQQSLDLSKQSVSFWLENVSWLMVTNLWITPEGQDISDSIYHFSQNKYIYDV